MQALALALASSLFCGFAAAQYVPQPRMVSGLKPPSPQPGAQKELAVRQELAINALNTTADSIDTTGVISQIQDLHKKFQNYKWRTVYAFGQVSKAPLPGTRLALRPLPAMSQWDAEQYLMTTPDAKDLPGLNCPVASLGGPAGRPVVVSPTVAGKTVAVTLSDAQIKNLFMRASPASGAKAFDAYMRLKTATCGAIYNTAQLTFRYAKFLSYPEKWAECQKDGASVSEWTIGDTFHFAGLTRYAGVGGGISFKCGAKIETSEIEKSEDGGLTYESWFKWSDHNPTPLNLFKLLLGTDQKAGSCPDACIPLIGNKEVGASLCIGLDPGISAVGDTAPMRFGLKFSAHGRDEKLCTKVIPVPAPFGLAAGFAEMGEQMKQDAMFKMQTQIVSLLPINNKMKGHIERLYTLFGPN